MFNIQKYPVFPVKVKNNFTIMRFLFRKTCLLLISLFIVLTSIQLTSFADGPDRDQGATITISNITPGDEFKAFKIIDINYDSGEIVPVWNSELHAIFVEGEEKNITPTCTVEDYIAMSATERAKIIQPIKKAFVGEGTLVKSTANQDGIVTFTVGSSSGWGSYLILCSDKDKADNYCDMVGNVQPVWDNENNTWKVVGDEIIAKKTVLNLSYRVSTSEKGDYDKSINAGSWNTLYYQLESDVPQYDSGVAADKRKFIIENTMATGLCDPTNIKTYGSVDGTNFDSDITSAVSLSGTTIDFTSAIADNQYSKVKIEYSTTFKKASDENQGVSEEVILGNTGNPSIVKAIYNQYDGSAIEESTEDTATVCTYGLQIMVMDRDTALSGVEFNIYRSIENEDSNSIQIAYSGSESNQPLNGILLGKIVSSDNGLAIYRGLTDVENYYIQDINNKLLSSVEKLEKNDEDNDGFYECTLKKENPIINLPETGSRGTIIFTIVGLSLMGSAVVLLFIIRKKFQNSNN